MNPESASGDQTNSQKGGPAIIYCRALLFSFERYTTKYHDLVFHI
jgi:hypothetical protein